MSDHLAVLEELVKKWRGFESDFAAHVFCAQDLEAAIALMRGQSWQDIATIPRDGSTVELLSANGKRDSGNWYNWPGAGDDVQVHLNTSNGEGNYTHWRYKQEPAE